MGNVVYRTRTAAAAETVALARLLAPALAPGTILVLDGELGAGKTTFVKGLAAGLGLETEPRSPTYTLIREYGVLVHADLYRLDGEDAGRIGLEEYLDGIRILAVEWGSHLPAAFWGGALVVKVGFIILNPEERSLEFHVPADASPALLTALEAVVCE